jgi:thiol-disulfide isomerase/thioredoxin
MFTGKKMFKAGLFFTFLGLAACQEIPPTVPPLGDRKVLVEEFTGVRCVNCPAGAAELENLKATYGDRLVIISVHAGDFALPYTNSQFDFRTPEGDALEKLLGAPIGYPTAVVNRKKFAGEERLQVLRSTWAGRVAQETTQPSTMSLVFVKKYNASTRQFDLEVRLALAENFKENEDLRLNVVVTESGVRDLQQAPSGIISDYNHKYILRKALSRPEGDPLTQQVLKSGAVISSKFSVKLPENWKAENCQIVAFVTRNGNNNDFSVLQVGETKLTQP